jgi:hypothetical protein
MAKPSNKRFFQISSIVSHRLALQVAAPPAMFSPVRKAIVSQSF